MKLKIKLQKDYVLIIFVVILGILLYIQYWYNRKNLINSYKNKEYAKTIQIKSDFNNLLSNIEVIFKTHLNQNLRVLNSLFLLYHDIKSFNPNRVARILNKENKGEGYYQVFVIDKNYKIIKASYKPDLGLDLGKFSKYKKVFEDVFSGKEKINISYLIFDYSSFTLKRYFLILSPDKKYLLQLAYVVDIYPKLRDVYVKILNNYRDLNDIKLYFMDKYLIYPVNFKKRYQPKRPIEYVMKNTTQILIKILKHLNLYAKYKNIIHNKNLGFEKLAPIVLHLFHTHNNILDKLHLDKHIYITYTLTEGFFKKLSNRLIIQTKFSTFLLEKDLENIKTRFLIILMSLVFLAIFIKFIITYTSLKIKDLVKHMKDNKPLSKPNSFIKELDDLAETYNWYRNRLNEEIEKNKKLLMENKRFIVDTVHQLKTPLSIITLNSDFLKMQLQDKNMEDTLNEIEAAIAMLTDSYEDLSYLAAKDAVVYKPVKLNISEIVKSRVEFFMPLAKARDKNLIYKIDEDIYFNINKVELERLVDNNISNAIDYSKGRDIKILLKKTEKGFILQIESFGDQIKNPQKIFEKNYREHSHKRGLGIGLNIVKNICDKYNIKYEVFSFDGKNIFKYIFHY